MAHLRTIALSLLVATGCGAPLLSPPLRYSASLTTSVSTYDREDEHADDDEHAVVEEEHVEDRDVVVVQRKRACNPCRRRVYVTPYYYYFPYINVY
jgi:hypothetical protein